MIRDDLDALGARGADLDRARGDWEDELAAAISRARAEGIGGAEIAERTGLSRAWLYRRYAAEMRGESVGA
jgi:hypothetical protein